MSVSPGTGRHYPPGTPQTAGCDASVPIKRKSKIGVSMFTALRMRWTGLNRTAPHTLRLAFPGLLTHDAYGSATDHGNDNAIRLFAGATLLFGPRVPVNVSTLSFAVPVNETAGGQLSLTCDTVGSPKLGVMFQFLFGGDCKLAEVWLLRG